jgi:hypothetical protein
MRSRSGHLASSPHPGTPTVPDLFDEVGRCQIDRAADDGKSRSRRRPCHAPRHVADSAARRSKTTYFCTSEWPAG